MMERVEFPDQFGREPGTASDIVSPMVPGVHPTRATLDKQSLTSWQPPNSIDSTQPAVSFREIPFLLSIVALADVTIFRGTGYSGVAIFLLAAPFLLMFGSPAPVLSPLLLGVTGLIWMAGARLIWQGSWLVGLAGLSLLIAFAMSLIGRTPFVMELLGFAGKAWVDGVQAITAYDKWIRYQFRHYPQFFSLHWILPLAAVAMFGGIFVAANPDLVQFVWKFLLELMNLIQRWFSVIPTSPLEVLFCVAVGWYSTGLLRPSHYRQSIPPIKTANEATSQTSTATAPGNTPSFVPYRNTLAAVSLLFAIYLVFEFQTLWFRTFPKGFHYSGYAHQGAAWLTVALALATAVLSAFFRGPILRDPRLPKLRMWAWIWSIENLALALAVYNRMWIYIGFNGMTRMRTVALFGISAVLFGFLLVLWKIAYNRSFLWLLRRHLLTVALAGYVYLLIPVDWLVYSYNVHRILAGDPAPVVQITEHAISPEGLLTLPPLMQSSEPVIRDGIESLLAEKALDEPQSPNQKPGWTSFQLVHEQLTRRLAPFVPEETQPDSKLRRQAAWQRLRVYAYQWY